MFGLVLMLCALGFKMSAAPFHMWTPDVYEGAPTPVTAFFAAAPKVAAVALMARVLYEPFAGLDDQWRQVVAALSAISMVWGSIGALLQTNLKRLMAYSSIANMGFVLMGLASGRAERAGRVADLPRALSCRRTSASSRSSSPCAATARRLKLWPISLASRRNGPGWRRCSRCCSSPIAGIPPFAGFIGKLLVFIGRGRCRPRLARDRWRRRRGGGGGVLSALLASIWFSTAGADAVAGPAAR